MLSLIAMILGTVFCLIAYSGYRELRQVEDKASKALNRSLSAYESVYATDLGLWKRVRVLIPLCSLIGLLLMWGGFISTNPAGLLAVVGIVIAGLMTLLAALACVAVVGRLADTKSPWRKVKEQPTTTKTQFEPLQRQISQEHTAPQSSAASHASSGAVSLDPAGAEGHFWKSVEAYKRNDLQGAIRELEKAVALNPEATKYWNNLATFYGNIGDWNKAEPAWQKLMQLGPDSEQITNYTATLSNKGYLAFKEGKIEEMIQWYEKALTVDPTQPLALKELGFHYQKTEQWQKAISYLERAVKSATKPLGGSASVEDYRAELKDRIATCYYAMGNYPAAIQLWEESLAERTLASSEREAIEKDIAQAKSALQRKAG